jgi:predicted flap endonuclease-1-like 5' DNA nuclease
MEFFNCWLKDFPWGIFLGCLLPMLLLWWWLSRQVYRWKNHSSELQDRIKFLEGELDACRKSKISASTHIDSGGRNATGISGAGVAAGTVGLAGAVSNATSIKKDDLKIVEGIGPKIEELFNSEGIFTFAELAATSVDKMKAILDTAGPRFQIHNPATWANQAAMARDGNWDELKKWQDILYKGKA